MNEHIAMNRIITSFTILSLLQKMREELGLEAMCEYLSNYENVIKKKNPELDKAVKNALAIINIEKIYNDAREMADDRKKGKIN